MSLRNEHKFAFRGQQIADSAKEERDYHAERIGHWQERAEKALAIVKETIGAKVVEQAVTGGQKMSVVVDYGNPEAWREYQLAVHKIEVHRDAKERFSQDAITYGTQATTMFELDRDDVRWFRLGGEPRED